MAHIDPPHFRHDLRTLRPRGHSRAPTGAWQLPAAAAAIALSSVSVVVSRLLLRKRKLGGAF